MQISKFLQVLLFGLITIIQSPLASSNTSFPTTKKFDVSQLITKDALQCITGDDGDKYIDFYFKFDDVKKDFPNLNGKPYQFSGYTVTGINAINSSKIIDKEGTTTSRNMDVNFNKFGVTVLRISKFGYQPHYHSEGEGGGYYIVLKGTPKQNLLKLKLAGIPIDNDTVAITPAKNTRIICTLVG